MSSLSFSLCVVTIVLLLSPSACRVMTIYSKQKSLPAAQLTPFSRCCQDPRYSSHPFLNCPSSCRLGVFPTFFLPHVSKGFLASSLTPFKWLFSNALQFIFSLLPPLSPTVSSLRFPLISLLLPGYSQRNSPLIGVSQTEILFPERTIAHFSPHLFLNQFFCTLSKTVCGGRQGVSCIFIPPVLQSAPS